MKSKFVFLLLLLSVTAFADSVETTGTLTAVAEHEQVFVKMKGPAADTMFDYISNHPLATKPQCGPSPDSIIYTLGHIGCIPKTGAMESSLCVVLLTDIGMGRPSDKICTEGGVIGVTN